MEITTKEQLVSVLQEAKSKKLPVFFDTETQGLYGKVVLVQMNIANELYYIQTFKLPEWLDIFKNINPYIIGVNINYDFNSMQWMPDEWEDIQWLARMVYPQWQEYSLDKMVKKATKRDFYAELGIDKKKMQKLEKWKYGEEVTEEQLVYALLDVKYLPYLFNLVEQGLTIPAYRLDKKVAKEIFYIQQNKLYVDKKALKKEIASYTTKITSLEARKIELAGDFNIKSYKQVREALGTNESSKEFLTHLVSEDNSWRGELASIILELRKAYKKLNILESYDTPEGWVQTIFNVYGTITGRFSATGEGIKNGINAQQIPREFQYLFQQNTEDTIAIHADFSTAEVRAAAAIMPDRRLAQYLKDGVDIHKVSASLATGKKLEEITKEDRQKGKSVTFGLLFGMSAPTFVEYAFTNYGVKFTLEEATKIRQKFMSTYQGVAKWINYWWGHYERQVVQSPLGRKAKPKLGTNAINYAIQSAIAETTKIAILKAIKLEPEMRKWIFNAVHDAIDLRVPKGQEHYAKDILVEAMLGAWEHIVQYPMFKIKDIPMGVEYSYIDSEGNKQLKEIFRTPERRIK